jgi:hypothetical protein
MDEQTLFVITGITIVASLLVSTHLLAPKAIEQWKMWKKTNKSIHLSSASLLGFMAASTLFGLLLRFLRIIAGV